MTLLSPPLQTPETEQPLEAAIRLTQLSYAYPERGPVLKSLNLTLYRGEQVGILGPNGAGKTTLFKLISGVLKPTTGNVCLLDQPVMVGGFQPALGLVFQNPEDQLFSTSVWDDVAFGPQNMGLSPTAVTDRVDEALTLTGTHVLRERMPHHLSIGEKRMVAIATILAMRPQVIIYDEPSANLDIRARRRLIQFLRASQETQLVASHDLELIVEVCDRIIVLDGGTIVADGHPVAIMSRADIMEPHGLEVPHSLR